ncbi:hypothetical protein EJB05_00372 [Eragrostis curvula]|uniref:Uncharacterized protein n=1 Tax=Eragrostis curvula TaxID=38414 RepID=A0A5J9WLV5_9POAL|nr:hypothetical protein EJB05_00372 [Eragrostis curvula]
MPSYSATAGMPCPRARAKIQWYEESMSLTRISPPHLRIALCSCDMKNCRSLFRFDGLVTLVGSCGMYRHVLIKRVSNVGAIADADFSVSNEMTLQT